MNRGHYDDFLRKRFFILVDLTKLPIAYIEDIAGISSTHFYNIKNGQRIVSSGIMEKVGDYLDLPLMRVFDPDCDLKKYARITDQLQSKLKEAEAYNAERSKKVIRAIEMHLLGTIFFENPVPVALVRDEIREIVGKNFKSHEVAMALEVLAGKDKLEKLQMPILKGDGNRGTRVVNYYSNPKPNTG